MLYFFIFSENIFENEVMDKKYFEKQIWKWSSIFFHFLVKTFLL